VQGNYPIFSPRYVSWQKGRVAVITFISYTCFHLQKSVSLPLPSICKVAATTARLGRCTAKCLTPP
jgi:hypothetical protein